MPPFNPEASLAYISINKMQYITSDGPLKYSSQDFDKWDSYQYLWNNRIYSGYFFKSIDSRMEISDIDNINSSNLHFYHSSETEYVYTLSALFIPENNSKNLLSIQPSGSGQSRIFNYSLLNYWSSIEDSTLNNKLPADVSNANTEGVFIAVNSNINVQPVNILYKDLNNKYFYEAQTSVTYAAPDTTFPQSVLFNPKDIQIPETEFAVNKYFHNKGSSKAYSYASGSTAAGTKTYRWYYSDTLAKNVVDTISLDASVTRVLTNGMFFAKKGGYAYLYDENGRETAAVPLGDLKLSNEIWDTVKLEYQLIFSRFRWISGRDEEKMYIDFYSVPTAEFHKLAD
jgi:hypothetical protein